MKNRIPRMERPPKRVRRENPVCLNRGTPVFRSSVGPFKGTVYHKVEGQSKGIPCTTPFECMKVVKSDDES